MTPTKSLFVVFWREEICPGCGFGWCWTLGGYDDDLLRSVDLGHYKTRKALFAELDLSDTYKSLERIKRKK